MGAELRGGPCGPHGGYLLTSNNRKRFGGISEVNLYFKFMGVVVCSLIFKGIFVILQDNAQLDEKIR